MEREDNEQFVSTGMRVVDTAGEEIGSIDAVGDGYFVVRKGTFFPKDYAIPQAAIAFRDERTVALNLTREQVKNQDWDAIGQVDVGFDEAGQSVIPIKHEELEGRPRTVIRGKVRIETRVFEEPQEVEVPVTEERVRVERRVFDRDAAGNDVTVDGGTFEVPFYGQDVDLIRNARVIEEIVITREAVDTVRRVRGTVRREEVTVDESTVDDAARIPEDEEPAQDRQP